MASNAISTASRQQRNGPKRTIKAVERFTPYPTGFSSSNRNDENKKDKSNSSSTGGGDGKLNIVD